MRLPSNPSWYCRMVQNVVIYHPLFASSHLNQKTWAEYNLKLSWSFYCVLVGVTSPVVSIQEPPLAQTQGRAPTSMYILFDAEESYNISTGIGFNASS